MLKETDYNSIIGMLGCIAEESGQQGVSIKTIKRILQQYTNFPNGPKDGPERGKWLQEKFQKMPNEIDKAITDKSHKRVPIREPRKQCYGCEYSTGELTIDAEGNWWHGVCHNKHMEEGDYGIPLINCSDCGCLLDEGNTLQGSLCRNCSEKWLKEKDRPVPHKEVTREQHEVSGMQAGKSKIIKQQEDDYNSITRTASKVKTLYHCHKCKKYTKEYRWIIVDDLYWHEKCWEDCSAPYKLSMKFIHSKDSQWCHGCEESNEKGVKADSRGWWWHKDCFAREGIENPVQGEATECVECERFLMKGDCLLEKLCWMCFQQRKLGKEIEDGYKGNFAKLEIACAARMNQCFQCGSSKGKLIKDERGFWWHKKCQEEYLKESKMRAHKIHDKQESSTDEKTETKNACFLCDHTGQEFGTLIEDEYQKGRWYHRECGDTYAAFLKRRQCTDCGKPSTDLDDENCCPDCRDEEDEDEQPYINKKKIKQCPGCGSSDGGELKRDASGQRSGWWHEDCLIKRKTQYCCGCDCIGGVKQYSDGNSWHPNCWEEHRSKEKSIKSKEDELQCEFCDGCGVLNGQQCSFCKGRG